jgi:hypothetical protein
VNQTIELIDYWGGISILSVHGIIEPIVRLSLEIFKILIDFSSICWIKNSSVLSMNHTIEHVDLSSIFSSFCIFSQGSLKGSIVPVLIIHLNIMTVPLEIQFLLEKGNWLSFESGLIKLNIVLINDLFMGCWIVNSTLSVD